MTTLDHYYAVIMAGGGGTRLWPFSIQSHPKQVLQITGNRSLFQVTIDRLEGLFPTERIFVVTTGSQAEELKKQCPQVPKENFFLEPMPRGTASVIGLAAVALRSCDPEAIMCVLTSDHYIGNVPYFQFLLSSAYQIASKGFLVTLGIKPTYPATGYGYIQRGQALLEFQDNQAFQVKRFKEKPNEDLAREMVAAGDYDWNSGMFFWRVDRIMDEFHRSMPELAGQLEQIGKFWLTGQRETILNSIWPEIKPETIDYGVMEKAENVIVLSADELGWNDIGSWDSLFEVLPADENGNIIIGAEYLGLDTKSSLVCADSKDRLIVTIGMKNVIVVVTGKALLVCPREETQRVREIVNILNQKGYQNYL